MKHAKQELPFTLTCLKLAMNVLYVYITADLIANVVQAMGPSDGTKNATAFVVAGIASVLIGMRLNDRLVRFVFSGLLTKGDPCEK